MSAPWPVGAQGLRIGDLLIDLRYRRLITDSGSVEVQQRIFELLLLLISEPDKLFTRQELFDRLWAGLVVDDANLSQSIWLLRKALGESRRGWIRTIAKRGYVFHPPGPVQWLDAMPAQHMEASAAPPVSADGATEEATPLQDPQLDEQPQAGRESGPEASIPSPAGAPPAARRRSPGMVAVAALMLVAVAMALWAFWPRASEPVSVALVTVPTRSEADAPWAAELLRHWTGWKLQQLPDIQLLKGEEVLANRRGAALSVALLSATRSADGERVTLRVRVQRQGRDQVLEKAVPLSAAPAAIDELSRQLVRLLAPDVEDAWPSLEVDGTTAQRYASVAAAYERGDWSAVQQGARAILTQAPRFGLMHVQLAVAQSELGESLESVRHMELANTLLLPLPDTGRLSLRAMQLEMDQRRAADAERAVQQLLAAHPNHLPYQLRYARLLIRTGKFDTAISYLESTQRTEDASVDARYQRALLYGNAYYGKAQFDQAKRAAGSAREIATSAGMRLQAAQATLLEANIVATVDPAQGEQAYRMAAQKFKSAGAVEHAEYADVLATVHAGQVARDSKMIEGAMHRAERAGNLLLVANIQVTLAGLSPSTEGRLHWVREALQTARKLGNLNMQGQFEVELAMDDLFQLRLAEAQSRATQLQALGLQGVAGIRVNVALARIFEAQGRLRDAGQTSKLALMAARETSAEASNTQVQVACQNLRVSTYMGVAPEASTTEACTRADDVISRFTAASSQALVALLVHDRAEARQHYEGARALIDGADRAKILGNHSLGGERLRMATIALRLGDIQAAERHASALRASAQQGGLVPLMRASLIVLDAEISAAQGNWEASRSQAASARNLLPAAEAELRHRLDLLQVADAERHARPAEAIERARQLYRQAASEGDLRTQLQVLSLLPPSAQPSLGADVGRVKARHAALPGATMAWLSSHERAGRGK
ncbi:winged helix-turn-helix domain-containing protein [Stenotrophomonas tuberculopleuritidis]|uniref:winged helix-turn-helix domain-containing protein n=1 Tax=Stenotrophomonas tuberculopleuritidis TaxID=3055079 RepID=UPI0026E59135|nr:winged helix-turn-helix domain-containing protein [Stenotrophomonas sp. 704A1]